MRGSWKIIQIAGIGVFVHWTFLFVIGWIVYMAVATGGGAAAAVHGLVFIIALFACIVAHEFGHALTARRFGIRTRDITLLPIGGLARLERMPEDPTQELLVALGGPAVTLLIAAACHAVVAIAWGPGAMLDLDNVAAAGGNLLVKLAWVNWLLLVFNMIPAFPMDGGRVLRAALHYQLPYVDATRIAARIGQGLAVLMGLVGVLMGNLFLILIAVFVFFGAREESRSVEVRSLTRGVPVSHAMVRRFRVLAVDDPLDAAVEQLIAGEQRDFPVIGDDRIVGMLTRDDLVRAVAAESRDRLVSDVMRRDCAPADANETLETVLERMRVSKCAAIPITRRGALVGLLTLENIGEWMMIESARRQGEGM